ncbi:AMP-binding protein, partial [Streptomyces inhibens]|uniref:AMP-binding protein n=1 Tax=Streptomyces inhibens TaxID=2293571 RepID=UPI0036B852F6
MPTERTLLSERTPSGGFALYAAPSGRPGTRAGLPALVAWHAERAPHALAVADGDTTLTYAQLVSAARALAAHLQRHGVRRGDPVALLMPRSARTVMAQLALWWAGAVCVPLDPAHPRARSEALAADAGVTLTVGDGKLLESAAPAGATLALPDEPLPDVAPALAPAPELGPDAAAFILFTSGSTGRPKGVGFAHRGLADLVSGTGFENHTTVRYKKN